jgi:HNH endonuclease
MNRYIPESMRLTVTRRANSCCEYCLYPEVFAFFPYHIDHIISIKHGGGTTLDNLAYSCITCNANKGSDIGTVLLPQRHFIRLYNPRIDRWDDHFEWNQSILVALSDIGEATIKVLNLNEMNRIIERRAIGLG